MLLNSSPIPLAVAFVCAVSTFLFSCKKEGAEIWNGPVITYTKEAYTDWTQPPNYDFITSEVCLTRADTKGLFNVAQESEFQGDGSDSPSPVDTEWAIGTLDQIEELEFLPMMKTIDNTTPSIVGPQLVVHLISDDIYLSVRFVDWDAGGRFSYVRSTKN